MDGFLNASSNTGSIVIFSFALYFLCPEKDVNGDTLWVWCYPSVGSDLRQVLLRKCCLTQDSRDFHTFVFGQYCRTWYYITTAEVQEPTALNKVQCPETLLTFKSQTRNDKSAVFLSNVSIVEFHFGLYFLP